MGEYHVVRSSERQAHRRCKRLWDWSWRQGWQPVVGPQPLEFGTAYHAGMEVVYDPALWSVTTPEQKLKAAIDAFTACCDEQQERYLLAIGQPRLTLDGRDDYAGRIELGKRMLEYYVLEVHPREDNWFRPVKVEIKFQVPICDEHGEPVRCWNSPACGQEHEHGAEVVHEGRIDLLVEDIVQGGYYAFDWKSVGGNKAIDGHEKNTSRFSREDLVWMHDQLSTYCMALRIKLKLDVRGFVLAEIRKDYPKPPALLRRRRNGALYSQDKNMATTLELYEIFIKEHDLEGYAKGAYNDYLNYLDSDEAPIFHKRFKRDKTDAELREVEVSVSAEVEDLVRLDVKTYPQPGPIACTGCAFRSPCEMKMRGYDYTFTLNSDYAQTGHS